MQQTLKVAHIPQYSPNEGEFRHNYTKLTMFVFVKSIKGCFQRGSFNNKHVNLSLLKNFYPFKRLKNNSLQYQRKKDTQFVKMLRLLHLITFDPILKPTYEHLVITNTFSMFFRLITISIQNLAGNEICLHIKR